MALLILFGGVFFLQIASVFPVATNRLCSEEESEIIHGNDQGDKFIGNDGTVYRMGHFWRENSTNTTFGCVCSYKSCLRKCCPLNQVVTSYNDNTLTCGQVADKQWDFGELDIYSSKDVNKLEKVSNGGVAIGAHVGNPCEFGMFPTNEFYILDDGQIYEQFENSDLSMGHSIHEQSRYCVDYMNVTFKNETHESFEFIIQAQICIDEDGDAMQNSYTLYAVCIMINNVFLLMTLIVYCSLEKLRNTMGKCLIFFVVCLLIGYAALFFDRVIQYKPPLECTIIAYTMYFFLLAGFFWLNVMCYDIYSAFRKMKSMPRSQSKKRYVMIGHSCYAWGCPLVMTVFAYFVDMIGPSWLIRPRLAVSSCWFGETASLYLYFYGPMMLLLAANIYFFAITIYKLYEVSKQTAVLKNSESNSNHEKERDRCYLYGKLFVVMGVSWVMEVVSERLGGSEYLWYLTDIFNICQGIGIFIIFVLKRRVLYMLNKKFLPSHMFISECETTKATSSSTATTSNNGNALNGAALNGNGRKQEAADNMYVEKGYDNPIPMTPISTRVDAQNGGTTNGDVSVPIDDTTVIQRY
ncbi:G-protein coupled receptor Mth2 isoform X3 [Nilaparvata lugens]|uniref:G-protein coupled receptor Mth2 isoform X3 n=1 Tax=Nilaparvata lugens TaxID=108931 RepID=UPI00193DD676|nr:G-protein coupled receptor Mth2 isoform X3 [Nilaparvata lugens]